MSKTYNVPDHHVETIENAIDAVEHHEDIEVDRSRGKAGGGTISTGKALAKICEAYTGRSG